MNKETLLSWVVVMKIARFAADCFEKSAHVTTPAPSQFHGEGGEVVGATVEGPVVIRSLAVRSSFRCSSWRAVTFVLVHICHGSRVYSCSVYKENTPTRGDILNGEVGATL